MARRVIMKAVHPGHAHATFRIPCAVCYDAQRAMSGHSPAHAIFLESGRRHVRDSLDERRMLRRRRPALQLNVWMSTRLEELNMSSLSGRSERVRMCQCSNVG